MNSSLPPTPTSKHSIVIAAGGTGGHVFPAVALAEYLQRHGERVVMCTDKRALKYGSWARLRSPYIIPSSHLSGSLFSQIRGILVLTIGFLYSLMLLYRVKAKIVLGFGGYPVVPVMAAAFVLRIPIGIHEQNAVLGRVNRFLSPIASFIAITFPNTQRIPHKVKDRVHLIGTPVREEFSHFRHFDYPPLRPPYKILVIGGSQGAVALTHIIPEAMVFLSTKLQRNIELIQQCPAKDNERLSRHYQNLDIKATLSPFFDNIPELLSSAHLVIARSGASTLSELIMVGRPGIMIPYPQAKDDHQRINAMSFTEAEAGWMYVEEGLDALTLAKHIEKLFNNPALLQEAAAKSRALGKTDVLEQFAQLIKGTTRS